MTAEGEARIAAALERLAAAVEALKSAASQDEAAALAEFRKAFYPSAPSGRCPDCGLPAHHAGWCLSRTPEFIGVSA